MGGVEEGWGGGGGGVFYVFGTRMVSHLARTRFLDRWKLKDEEGTFKSLFGRMNNYSFNYQERELFALDWPESPTTTSPRHCLKT